MVGDTDTETALVLRPGVDEPDPPPHPPRASTIDTPVKCSIRVARSVSTRVKAVSLSPSSYVFSECY